MNILRAAAVVALVAFAAGPAGAEEEHVPVPYAPEEFPAWARDLRRAEIVFFGSLPFSFFFTFEAYDTGKYLVMGLVQGFDHPDAPPAPWPFRAGSEIGATYDAAEKGWLIASALTVSLAVAVVDYLIVHRPAKREDR
jgi:hypothetical protein